MIADILVADAGRISVVAHRMRKKNNNKSLSGIILQPFTRFNLGWRGKNELKMLVKIEADKNLRLQSKYLFCGLYANELLIRLFKKHIPSKEIFNLYEWLVTALSKKIAPEPYLRLFEKALLDQLGYGLPLQFEATTFTPIKADRHYIYSTLDGFSPNTEYNSNLLQFPGWLLLDYAKNHITDEMLPLLKRLNRIALASLLGNKPLKSRSLFNLHTPKKQ